MSYSHDSAEHKGWVLDFATTLRDRGIDAVLDQWDLKPGDDLPHFMETQLGMADNVLMICTEKYVEKANGGEGGVGYEKMIITSSLLSKIDSNIAIPIIRQSGKKALPTFLKTKLYIDFSNDQDIEYCLDELLRVLLNAPLYEKPEMGKNPFKPMQGSKPDRVSDGVKEVMVAVAKGYENTSLSYIDYSKVVKNTSMHRLTLDRYFSIAVEKGLVKWYTSLTVEITSDGIEYLVSGGIIEG